MVYNHLFPNLVFFSPHSIAIVFTAYEYSFVFQLHPPAPRKHRQFLSFNPFPARLSLLSSSSSYVHHTLDNLHLRAQNSSYVSSCDVILRFTIYLDVFLQKHSYHPHSNLFGPCFEKATDTETSAEG